MKQYTKITIDVTSFDVEDIMAASNIGAYNSTGTGVATANISYSELVGKSSVDVNANYFEK